MLREKQIEELGKILCGMKNGCDGCMWNKVHCNEKNYAEEIYKAGYRKQSEQISCSHEKGGEWISVDERLPKKRQKCLCYYPEKDYGSKVVVDYAETDDGGFAEQFQFGKPSHWMPLPKAPKMKGGER